MEVYFTSILLDANRTSYTVALSLTGIGNVGIRTKQPLWVRHRSKF